VIEPAIEPAIEPEIAAMLSETSRKRTEGIVAALGAGSEDASADGSEWLAGPTLLEGWSRLTVACHLRYGARASRRMTLEALAGEKTSFYPGGRSSVRPSTLVPADGESPSQVLVSLGEESRLLHDLWGGLSPSEWLTPAEEPDDARDLGGTSPAVLAVLRSTEVEVHGTDLDLGLPDWSELFVSIALPVRLARLASRRSNHREVDPQIQGSWRLSATDGPSWLLSVRGDVVDSRPVEPDTPSDAVIEATGRDLMALLLGRPPKSPPVFAGNIVLARSFHRAFPGP
jgi:hypothetical protein